MKSVPHTYQRIDLHKNMCYAEFKNSSTLYTSVISDKNVATWRDYDLTNAFLSFINFIFFFR